MAQVFEIDRTQLIEQVHQRVPELTESSSRELKLLPVKSYVQNREAIKFGGKRAMTVPSFATHWGVVVEEFLYHLTFKDPDQQEMDLKDSGLEGRRIELDVRRVSGRNAILDQCQERGATKYDHSTLIRIGDALIDAFGNYHRLFWNCQIFAECFLRLITNGDSFSR